MDNISLTVPMEHKALTRAAEMFNNLAADLSGDGAVVASLPLTVAPVITPANTAEPLTTATVKTEPARIDKPDPTLPDSEGIVWDARIHGSAQLRLVKDDTWKLIKGIEKKSPGLVAQVKAVQLAATPAATHPLATPAATNPLTGPNTTAPAATTPAIVTPITFAQLAEKITPRVVANSEYNATIQLVLGEFGVTEGLPMLMGMPELVPQVDARLEELWQG